MKGRGPIILTEGGQISTAAPKSDAQGISIRSDVRIELHESQITSQAARDGGNIQLFAPELIYLLNSQITAQAGNNGGNVAIDPRLVVLNHSGIVTKAQQFNGGDIRIGANFFVPSADSVLDPSGGLFGAAGRITLLGPAIDLSGSLVSLSGALLAAESHLPERCAVRLPGNFSSFAITGRGGLPLEPGDWQPSFVRLEEWSGKPAHGDIKPK
jgi:hypothetical protein